MLKQQKHDGHSTVKKGDGQVLKCPEELDCFTNCMAAHIMKQDGEHKKLVAWCLHELELSYNDSLAEEVHSKSKCIEAHWARDN